MANTMNTRTSFEKTASQSLSACNNNEDDDDNEYNSKSSAAEMVLKYGIINQIPSRKECIQNDELVVVSSRQQQQQQRRSAISNNQFRRSKSDGGPSIDNKQRYLDERMLPSGSSTTIGASSDGSIRSSIRNQMTRVLFGFTPPFSQKQHVNNDTNENEDDDDDQKQIFVPSTNDDEDVISATSITDTQTFIVTCTTPIIITTTPTVVVEEQVQQLDSNINNNINNNNNNNDDDDLVLYEIFRTFCIPAPTLHQIHQMLASAKSTNTNNNPNNDLPQNVVIAMGEGGSPVCRFLCSLSASASASASSSAVKSLLLLELPNYFLKTFFRILVRLVSNVTNVEYLQHLQVDNTNNVQQQQQQQHQHDKTTLSSAPQDVLLLLEQQKQQDTLFRRSSTGSLDSNTSSTTNNKDIRRGSSIQSSFSNVNNDPLHYSKQQHHHPILQSCVLYNSIRLRCSNEWTRYNTNEKRQHGAIVSLVPILQYLFCDTSVQKYVQEDDELVSSICWFTCLVVIGGISSKELKQLFDILSISSSSLSTTHSSQRWMLHLVRILHYAATNCDSVNVPFFIFDGTNNTSLSIPKTKPLWSWPFRSNDIGFAVWIRAERFFYPTNIQLFSLQQKVTTTSTSTDGCFAIHVILNPTTTTSDDDDDDDDDDTTTVATIAIRTTRTNANDEEEVVLLDEVLVGNDCILLPRIWYHVAVRYTSSSSLNTSLKGYFSSSTISKQEDEISIFVNGIVKRSIKLAVPPFQLPRNHHKTYMANLQFARNFNGETSALYVFNEYISDSTLRSLYERTSSSYTNHPARKAATTSSSSTAYEGNTTVLEVCNKNTFSTNKNWLDLDSSTTTTATTTGEYYHDDNTTSSNTRQQQQEQLSKANFTSKICLVWDPSRISCGNMVALEIHMGAHAFLNANEGVHAWEVTSAKDVIKCLGGIKIVLQTIQQLLVLDTTTTTNNNSSMLPNLLLLFSSFIRNSTENANELCDGIDILEHWMEKRRNSDEMRIIRSSRCLSRFLISSILDLRNASSNNFVLEAKVFSKLFVNFKLWLGGGGASKLLLPGIALHMELFPILSSVAKHHPNKMRDCTDVRDMIQYVHELTTMNVDEVSNQTQTQPHHASNRFNMNTDTGHLTVSERRHLVDVILGILVNIMTPKTTTLQLGPIVDYISFTLDAEFEMASEKRINTGGKKTEGGSSGQGSRYEKFIATSKACTVILFLLQVRPIIPCLFESFEICFDSPDGVASWIMCCMVNSFDDSIRATGIRSLAAYMDGIPNAAARLRANSIEAFPTSISLHHTDPAPLMKASMMATPLLKSVAKIRILGNSAENLARMNVQVVHKLLWHLLKCHRERLGDKSHAALVNLLVDNRPVKNVEIKKISAVIPDDILRNGFIFNSRWAEATAQLGIDSAQRLRSTFAINTILRLLRFLQPDAIERWLFDLLTLVRISPNIMAAVLPTSEWQPCLFFLLSEIFEEISRQSLKDDQLMTDSDNLLTTGVTTETQAKKAIADVCGLNPVSVQNLNAPRVGTRFDLCAKLYATLLGTCIRHGDKCYVTVEKVASLQRVCVNGHEIFGIVLSHLLNDLTESGTVENNVAPKPSESSPERSWALKASALVVTNAILSNGTQDMDIATAVKHWRHLRHLTSITVAFVTASGYGVVDLFDYRNEDASAVEKMSGGLQGIRLSDSTLSGLRASDILIGCKKFESGVSHEEQMRLQQRLGYRMMCVTLAAQMLSLLDSFIFPDSLDTSLPASQLHGLALVRSTEPRLGLAQGPLLLSLLRLSLVLLSYLEPSSVKFLQSCGRLRCLLHWTLELIRESVALGGYSAAFQELTAPLDRLVLAVVLQCHRALKKCSHVLMEVESSLLHKYFTSEESRNKHSRRLFRATFELREIVLAAYRGRNEVLRAALSLQAYEALQSGFEELVSLTAHASDFSMASRSQKEANLRIFLGNSWVQGFADVDTTKEVAIPEQVSNGQVFRNKSSSHRGNKAILELSQESTLIIEEYHRALDKPFESYCEDQRQWAETDAVRDLEYEGDVSIRNHSQAHTKSLTELARSFSKRSGIAASKWHALQRCLPALHWSWIGGTYICRLDILHWKIAKTVDSLHRRVLLMPNKYFTLHSDASYESMLGRERERERERLLKKAKDKREQQRLSEAMLKIASDAFFKVNELDEIDDVDDAAAQEEEENAEVHGGQTEETTPDTSVAGQSLFEVSSKTELSHDSKDSISWAKAFVWDDAEKVVQMFEPVLMVSLRTHRQGKLLLTTHSIYFHQISDDISVITKEKEVEKNKQPKDRRWRLGSLVEVHGRRYVLRTSAVELFFADSREIFISFEGPLSSRDAFFAKLRSCKAPLLKLPKSLNPRSVFRRSKITELWRRRRISNFEYLMQLNLIAGRTFNDINQYPVFPWVLANYTSKTLNLNDPKNFRDLTKPIGALNQERLNILLERFNDPDLFKEEEKFLYGSHYSSPGAVLYYMIRQEPFTSMHIELQSGRFDVPDRLFFDLSGCWRCCLRLTSDVKELIPEFFTCPEMFLNTNNFPLGTCQEGAQVSDVILPPWANGSAYEFVRKHALALESEYVSQNLNHWIDLIFGFKQRGPAAAAAHNVFHFLSYEGSVDLDSISDKVDREATESHIQNFGQTPSQLILKDPHPTRYPAADAWSPLINDATKFRELRCWTPTKQFGLSDSCGAVIAIHVLTEQIVVIYADMSVGSYRWSYKGIGSAPFLFKPDKLRSLGTRSFSLSPAAVSGSSSIEDRAAASSHYRARVVAKQLEHCSESSNCAMPIESSSFGVTMGGYLKESLSRKNIASGSRAIEGPVSLDSSYYLLSCGYWDGTIKLHTLDGLRLKFSASGGHRGPITCLSIGECGGMMVTGGQDATCRIWVVDHPNLALALTDTNARTSLGNEGGQERLLSCCHVLLGHITPISCVALSSDLDVVVSGSNDGLICVHLARKGKFVRSVHVNDSIPADTEKRSSPAVRKLVLHSQGFVAHMEDKMLHSCTINGVILKSVSAEDTLHAMVVSSDGQMLITGGDKFEVVIRAIYSLSVRCVLDLSKHGPIRCIALTPSENNPAPQFMYIGTNDGLVTIVDTEHEISTR